MAELLRPPTKIFLAKTYTLSSRDIINARHTLILSNGFVVLGGQVGILCFFFSSRVIISRSTRKFWQISHS